ncbi:MAG: zf-HC2 domain-containing protein [Candidatus Acidiferrales bacterium]
MSDHEKIRELLSLAAASALEPQEEQMLMQHLRECESCAAEQETWSMIGSALRRMPTPQPRATVVERARAQAQIRLAEEFEHRWNRTVITSLIVFAWVLTVMSWPVFKLLTVGVVGLFDPNFHHLWFAFAGFTATVWIAGGAAAALLSLQSRRERRLA